MLPLARPAMMTLAILTFLYAWNDYLWPLVSAQQREYFTITLGLAASSRTSRNRKGWAGSWPRASSPRFRS
jgi:ABC-type glycerol-3-phosphate transport system permease component